MNSGISKSSGNRPDLTKTALLVLLCLVCVVFLVSFFSVAGKPGIPVLQLSAILGSCLLLMPMVFSLVKRSGFSKSPPFWFVIHVICSSLGAVFIFFHVSNGDWLTPPGMVLFAMIFLILQGTLARAFVSQHISYVFARSTTSFNFGKPLTVDKAKLQEIIDKKVELLASLDSEADEALFSPTLKHWLKSPIKSFRYQQLAMQESRIVGARQRSGLLLKWWRRVHLVLAAIFFFGLLLHVIVVMFFAGYAAGDQPIYWWHITDWGR